MRKLDPFEMFVAGLCIVTVLYFAGHVLAALFTF